MNLQKEQFSNAYLRAVAAVAGYAVSKPEPDDDSGDWTLAARGTGDTPRRPRLDIQLKCTSGAMPSDHELRFELSVKNYDDLRPSLEELMVPRILVVVLVPGDCDYWIDQTEERLALRHCGYWRSLMGEPESDNKENVMVGIPRQQQFTVPSVRDLMVRIGRGEAP